MAEDTLNSLFLRSVDQYGRSVRWCLLGLFILLIFQFMHFGPFIRVHQGLEQSRLAKEHFSGAEKLLTSIESKLKEMLLDNMDEIEAEIDSSLADLKADFAELNPRLIAQVCARSAFKSQIEKQHGQPVAKSEFFKCESPSPPEQSQTESDPTRIQQPVYIQRRPAAQDQIGNQPITVVVSRIPKLRPELIDKIMRVTDRVQFLETIEPFIEGNYIEPFFDKIENILAKPEFAEVGEEMLNQVLAEKPKFPEASQQLDNLVKILQTLNYSLKKRHIDRPKEKYWWSTTEGKGRSISEIKIGAREDLKDKLALSAAVESLSNEVNQALQAKAELARTFESKLVEINENFQKQQERLASIEAPFGYLSLELEIVAKNFPLLLGLILSAMVIWITQRIKDVGQVAHLIKSGGTDREPWNWFVLMYTSLPVHLLSGSRNAGTGSSAQLARRVVLFDCVGVGVASFGWIVLSAWQLTNGVLLEDHEILVLTILGGLAVTLALFYKWFVISALARLAEL